MLQSDDDFDDASEWNVVDTKKKLVISSQLKEASNKTFLGSGSSLNSKVKAAAVDRAWHFKIGHLD